MEGLVISRVKLEELKAICNEESLKFLEILEAKKLSRCKKKIKKRNKGFEPSEWLIKKAEKFKEDLKSKQTVYEKRFKILLNELGVDYEFQKIVYYPKSFYIVDFFIPTYNTVFEIDGEYHKKQKLADRKRTEMLKKQGIGRLFRFKNLEVNNSTVCKQRIKNILSI